MMEENVYARTVEKRSAESFKRKTLLMRFGSRKTINHMGLYAFLGMFVLIYLFPLYFTLISSLKTDFEIFFSPFDLPKTIQLGNYARAWTMSRVSIYFKNSVILTVSTCLLSTLVASMAAYIFAKFLFRLRDKIYLYFLSGMMVPFQSTIIPLALVISSLGLNDNMFVVVLLMVAFGLPVNILILTGFMKGIPSELEESAIMDGCGTLLVFLKIILPMSVPAIVTITIMNFLGTWNNYIMPLVFLTKMTSQPLATGLLSFFGERSSDYGGIMAAIVISFIPPFIVFVVAQKKIEKGITAGALKG